MPNVSRYQFSASMYFGVCTTMCPSRCTLVGIRGGRCIALVRTFVWPKLNTCGVCAVGSASSRWVPDTTRTGSPLGSTRSTVSPPSDSGSGRTLVAVASASRRRSDCSAATNAGPRTFSRWPRRISTHGAPASLPRRCSSSLVRSTVAKPKEWANASALSRSGFSNSSQRTSWTLMIGLAERPECSPGRAPCSLCSSLCALCAPMRWSVIGLLLLDVLGWAGIDAGDFGSPGDDLGAGVLVGDLAFDEDRAARVGAGCGDRVGQFGWRGGRQAQAVAVLGVEDVDQAGVVP